MNAASAGSVFGSPPPAQYAETAARLDLVGLVLEATFQGRRESPTLLERFLQAPTPGEALALWLEGTSLPYDTAGCRRLIVQSLNRDVATLDRLLTEQLNAILHHPAFQKLESSWRGLHYLVDRAVDCENVKIRLLSVSWKELARDIEYAIEFDQSQLFHRIYDDEFGSPGGEPFGVLLGDFAIRPQPCAEHPFDDITTLTGISHVAAAAFAPFVASVHPAMFGLDEFTDLEQPLNLAKTFQQLDYLKWKAFRETEDSRFVGLALPQILLRLPYEDDGSRVDGFCFHESATSPGRENYLWGNAVYAFGAVLIRAFGEFGWLSNIRGVERDVLGAGVVDGLPVPSFATDSPGVACKCSTNVIVTDAQEQELAELGFMPLCHCKDTEFSVFYTTPSVQAPRRYDEPAATLNARFSAMLQYILCVSRFAHYLKVLARDKVGSFIEAEQCEDYLHRWLMQYVAADSEASPQTKAEYPLREASVRVRAHPDKPGSYLCVAHLWPHSQFDELSVAIRVTTELSPTQTV
jgi:type VI secretion system ImpC/EvpB family protein